MLKYFRNSRTEDDSEVGKYDRLPLLRLSVAFDSVRGAQSRQYERCYR